LRGLTYSGDYHQRLNVMQLSCKIIIRSFVTGGSSSGPLLSL